MSDLLGDTPPRPARSSRRKHETIGDVVQRTVRAPAPEYAPPPDLPPRPQWLELGAAVLYRTDDPSRVGEAEGSAEFQAHVRAKLAAGVELTICGIRPTADGWEIMSTRTARHWVPACDLTFLRRPPSNYHPWPRGMDLEVG